MNGISYLKKLFRDDRWLVLNGNYIAILETKGEASAFFPYIVSWMTWIHWRIKFKFKGAQSPNFRPMSIVAKR